MNAYFTEEGSVEAVNARMGPDINPRLADGHGRAREASPRLREGGAAHAGRMGHRHRLPDQDRPDLLGRAAGVHPPQRHARLLDAGRRDQQPPPRGRDREHRLRPVPRRRRAGAADGRQHLARRQGRELPLRGPRDRPRRQPGRGRPRRRLVRQRRRLLRRAAAGHPAEVEQPRHLRHRPGRPLQLRRHQAGLLPDPRRRSGGTDARPSRPPPLPPGPHALSGHRAGLPEGRHPHLRRRRPLPRLRHRLRREADPRRTVRAGRGRRDRCGARPSTSCSCPIEEDR